MGCLGSAALTLAGSENETRFLCASWALQKPNDKRWVVVWDGCLLRLRVLVLTSRGVSTFLVTLEEMSYKKCLVAGAGLCQELWLQVQLRAQVSFRSVTRVAVEQPGPPAPAWQ